MKELKEVVPGKRMREVYHTDLDVVDLDVAHALVRAASAIVLTHG